MPLKGVSHTISVKSGHLQKAINKCKNPSQCSKSYSVQHGLSIYIFGTFLSFEDDP